MKDLKLIDGIFSANEAKEILLNMISNKIQFHTIKDFRSEICLGEPEKKSQQRMLELRETRERVISILKEAEKENLVVEIQSSINISCKAKNQTEKI